jgi:hypothetical protein
MREHTVETLQGRYDRLQRDTSFEEWRQLSHDVLAALVEQQGLVITLQRQTLEGQRHNADDRSGLRARAEAAFAVVQRLHQLRRKVHSLLQQKRILAANDRIFALSRVA